MLLRQTDDVDVSGNIEHHARLVANDPRLVTGRDVGDVARLELDLLAVHHPEREPA